MTQPHPPQPPVVVKLLVADRIAAAVRGCPLVAGLHGGRFGEVATYLPGRRVPGVRLTAAEVAVHLVGRYPAAVAEIDRQVRAAVAPHLAGLPLMITIEDYTTPASAVPAAELSAAPTPAPPPAVATTPVAAVNPTKEIL